MLFYPVLILILFLALEWIFIRWSHTIGLSDVPNERSSHTYQVVRGGGVVILFAWLLYACLNGFLFTPFTAGLLLVALCGFLDDLRGLSVYIRLAVQGFAVYLLLKEQGYVQADSMWYALFLLILGVYLLNAVNFMDGINGILGIYFLVYLMIADSGSWLSLDASRIWLATALIAFLFFNFRKKALVFCGDVGSMTIAFLILGYMTGATGNSFFKLPKFDSGLSLQLISLSLLPVSVFLSDSFTTILYRIYKRQNILQAHRMHIYQLLTPDLIRDQRLVALLYAGLQLLINVIWMTYFCYYMTSIIFLFIIVSCFATVRWFLNERASRLDIQ